MAEKIKLARYRNTPYIVNFVTNGGTQRYHWAGSKGKKIDQKPVPKEVVDWLTMNSICFKKGELVIVEDNEETKEIKENIDEPEVYKKNTQSREDIEKLLKGNFPKMKKALKEITVDSQKKFVVEVARDMKSELPGGKIDFIAEWMDIEKDILFE
jgi:hypothetical protein